MKKRLLVLVFVASFPAGAMAASDNLGGCGWGSKLFDGQRGLMPNVLAATSNGSYGTNTFGMTSGTSGCTADGVVKSNWKTAMFIDGNKEKLARDMSLGSGETLDSLANLLGMQAEHRGAFFRATKESFAKIFGSTTADTAAIVASLKEVLAANGELAPYATAI